jgi:L-asparaginase
MKVRVLVTGGTFDKVYEEIQGVLSFKRTHVPEMLKLGRCLLKTTVSTLMMKDSLYMTAADRRRILTACRRAPEKRLVVTHGTDTMAETAAVLGRAGLDKTVVMTGAMRPYRLGSSDGLFNLGSALTFVQLLPPGVFVAMNGLVFPWDDVRKDRVLGVFARRGRQKTQARPRRRAL